MFKLEILIMNLRSDCAVGSDNISGFFHKKLKNCLNPPITFFCNLSFKAGIFPEDFKLAVVYLIHQGGDINRPNNYRPISILPTVS